MNHNDILNFNGEEIKIEDIFKKPTKEILIGLYIKTQKLDDRSEGMNEKINGIDLKIDNQWKNIGINRVAISRVKGMIFVILPVILTVVGYLITQHFT